MESRKTTGSKAIYGPVFHGSVTFNDAVHFEVGDKEYTRERGEYDQNEKECDQTASDDEVDLVVKFCDMDKYTKHLGNPQIYQITENKGKVLIINNGFEGTKSERKGSSYDIWRMSELWRKIGCDTSISKNLSCKGMKEKVDNFLKITKFSDIFVVILMSHGKSGDLIVGEDYSEMKVKDIIKHIQNCKMLKEKPKLIFIQMCRGEKAERVDCIDAGSFSTDESSWFKKILKEVMPNGIDIDSSRDMIEGNILGRETRGDTMIAFATQPEHVAFRSETGSWFITAIAKVFAEHAEDKNLLELMKMVKEEVKKNVSNIPGSKKYNKCTATIEIQDTMGSKELYFFPGCPNND